MLALQLTVLPAGKQEFPGCLAKSLFQRAKQVDPGLTFDPDQKAKEVGRKWRVKELVEEGKRLASAGNQADAQADFKQAVQLGQGASNPSARARVVAFWVEQGRGLTQAFQDRNQVSQAKWAYDAALEFDPSAAIPANDWNDLCWLGDLHDFAELVKDACERAVKAEPTNGDIRDSREVNLALRGDLDDAIPDFEAFVASTKDENSRKRRQRYLEVLKNDRRNPITPEEIGSLLSNDCSNLVQGIIAWDNRGSRVWTGENVERLCRGTSIPPAPPKCFSDVMSKWGRGGVGTTLTSQDALDLCAGTNDAVKAVVCFQEKIPLPRPGAAPLPPGDVSAALQACRASASNQ